ncbi:MAG: hypothetical protein U0R70_09210 [Solirubrobacteraceae bacterium]
MRPAAAAAVRALAAAAVALAVLAPAAGARQPPPGAAAWLGLWNGNFGQLYWYDLSYSAATWDRTGAETSTCELYGRCRYGWLLRGMWRWPKHGWVTIKGYPTGQDSATLQPCWLGPYSLEVPGAKGSACYPMLLYRKGDEAERGGFWKACFLPENCTTHHRLHGRKTDPAFSAGFRFTQRGRPDGHSTISTQTGGAGTLVWDSFPSAGESNGRRGIAAPGSAVFSFDEIPGGPKLELRAKLLEGSFGSLGANRRRSLFLNGHLTSSNDPHCTAGKLVAITLTEGSGGVPDQIKLRIPGCRDETWTSADRQRVDVRIAHPRKAG